ncbi:MAG: Flp pilus assembly protein CpaB [Chloroflexi bacterium]|nr:Flp pilus assembly protein CpaB [Chloroflexota bacterium]
MKRRRSYFAIALALVLGLVTSGLVWTYTRQMQQQVQDSKNLVPVVVAAREIPVRTKLTKAMLEVKQVNKDGRNPAAVASVDVAVGQVTRLPIAAGEQILPSKFTSKRAESGLTYIVPQGKRAVSVKVDEIIASGGNLLPGDRVDVLGVFDAKTMGKDQALYVLKDIEVLAIAQALEGESNAGAGLSDKAKSAVGPATKQSAEADTTVTVKPDPKAKTVTLAVSPEEAQRLFLASERGVLRLALRGFGETLSPELPPATLTTIQNPLRPTSAQITAVSISPTNARAGDVLKVEITIKNTSSAPLKSQGPDPEFTYVQGQTFHSQGFQSTQGTYRVGVNFDGQAAVPFPYRWGLGGDLPPGASTTIVGFVKLTYDMKPTNFWAGLILEPADVVQDNIGTTLVTVIPANTAVISVDAANVRSGPSIDASVIGKLPYGTQVPILGQQADWYKVQLEDGRQGFVAAGWIIQPNSSSEPTGGDAGGQSSQRAQPAGQPAQGSPSGGQSNGASGNQSGR